MLKMDLEYNDGVLFMRLKGSLERKNTYKLHNYLIPVLLKHKVKYLVCNLYDLERVDEPGIDALIKAKWAIKINEGKFYLCDVPTKLNEISKKLHIKALKDELSAKRLISV